jgi:hypothetical protein
LTDTLCGLARSDGHKIACVGKSFGDRGTDLGARTEARTEGEGEGNGVKINAAAVAVGEWKYE